MDHLRKISNPRRSSSGLRTYPLLAALALSGCGLVNVNGKPLSAPTGSPSIPGSTSGGTGSSYTPATTGSGGYVDEYGNVTPSWAPAWCGKYNGATGTGYLSIASDVEDEGYFSDRALKGLAQAQCEFRKSADDTAKIRGVAATMLGQFQEAWGVAPEQLDQVLSLTLHTTGNGEASSKACEQIAKPEKDAEAREADAINSLRSLACARDEGGDYDWFDVSAAGDLIAARSCSLSLTNDIQTKSADNTWAMLRFAQCNYIAERLNKPRYVAEVEAAKLPPYAHIMALAQYQRVVTAVTAMRAYFTTKSQRQPEMQAALFTEPANAAAQLQRLREANKEFIDPIARVLKNPGNRRVLKSMKGCSDKYYDAMKASISKSKPADEEAAKALFDEPLLGFLTAGFAVCEKNEKNLAVAGTFGELVGALPTGPRGAASWASMQYIASHPDDFDELSLGSGYRRTSLDINTVRGMGDSGVIATVASPADGMVAITFKTESWTEPTYACKQTGRIDRLDYSGDSVKIIYREKCRVTGKKKVSNTPSPVKVAARFAAELGKGRLVDVTYWDNGEGFVKRVFSDKSKSKLIAYMGFGW